MIIYLYRWKIKPGKEKQFEANWSVVTNYLLKKCGSLGSRLHHGDDDLWYGYAQWPSAEQRNNADMQNAEIIEARRLMKEATLEMRPEIILSPVSDFLVTNSRSK